MWTFRTTILFLAACAAGCAGTGRVATLPEKRCPEIKYHDFTVGTVSTYCEPQPGRIVVYEHTYPHGFAIFNPDGDDRVDRYCNRHRCVNRSEISTLPRDRRTAERQFFDTWDDVLRSLPESIRKNRR